MITTSAHLCLTNRQDFCSDWSVHLRRVLLTNDKARLTTKSDLIGLDVFVTRDAHRHTCTYYGVTFSRWVVTLKRIVFCFENTDMRTSMQKKIEKE